MTNQHIPLSALQPPAANVRKIFNQASGAAAATQP